ncbi:hypothetical protein UlMin_018785 [Ulmus minor]
MENEKISGNYFETKVSGPKLKAVWDVESTNTFCELCVKEVEVGHRPGTYFHKPQLKNKWDALKTDWKIWKDLIGKEIGLGWNSKKKIVDASDEWWLSKLQKYPQASKFHKEGIAPEIEEKFDKMFMNTITTGDYTWTPTSGFVPSESGKISIENVSLIESSGDSDENNIQETSKYIPSKRSREHLGKQSTRWMKGKEKKKVKVGGVAMLSEQIDRLVDAVKCCKSSETSSACNKTHEFTITQCIEVLKDISRLDKPLYIFLQLVYFVLKRREKCLWPWMKLISLVGSSMNMHMWDRN